jgi:hypothetical protein
MEGMKGDLDHLVAFKNERASHYHIINQEKLRKQRNITIRDLADDE